MRISVITVSYNSARTIAQTMDSVAKQTYPYLEHLVIDGNSSDDTVKIARSHSTPRTRITSEPDKGIYDAMNKGIQRATGDLICFLNSDDQYADDGVIARVAKHIENNRLDALFGDVCFFNEGDPARTIRHYSSAAFHPGRLSWGWMPAHPSMFMKREIYEGLGGFKADYRIAGDFEFIARVFANFEIHYECVPEVFVKMQTGGVSTASSIWGRISHNKELLRACRENGISTNIFKILLRYPLKLREWLA